MAFELVYRAENRSKSSGAPAGAFPKPDWAGKRAKIGDFRFYAPPSLLAEQT